MMKNNKCCVTIGAIPTSYRLSLSYEEQIVWLCNYTLTTIIPAINDNAETLEEVIALYDELKEEIEEIDLTNYYTKTEVNDLLSSKADKSEIPDLTNYVTNTDYATSSVGGVILISSTYGVDIHNGAIRGTSRTYEQYGSDSNRLFISKGTLESVIIGKGLIDSSKIKTTTSTTSGDVYDVTYINAMLGDIETLLGGI